MKISTKNVKFKLLNIISIMFAFIIIFSNILIFNILKNENRNNIFEKIKKESNLLIEKINFDTQNVNQIVWKKKDKEFIYKNKFYDIVKIENKANQIIIYCVQDILEKDLTKLFSENISNSSKSSNQKNLKLNIFQIFLFFEKITIKNIFDSKKFKFKNQISNIISIKIKPLFPPPKF